MADESSEQGNPEADSSSPVQEQQPVSPQTAQQSGTHQFGFQVVTGPAPHPIHEKVTKEHVDRILKLEDDSRKDWSLFRLVALIGGILGFLVLCWLFLYFEKGDLLQIVLTHFIAFIGGLGLGRTVRNKSQ